jgi:tol-pal system protein YbgF
MPGGVGAANDLYQSGVTQFRRGQYSAARIAFGDIVDSYPNDPVAPDARFFLAQILVEEGEAEEALEAFLQIPEYHPASERAPEAYYHAALLYLELGDRAEAERHLDLVINTWPESDAAALARDTVRELR